MQSLIYFILILGKYRKQVIYNNLKKGIRPILSKDKLDKLYTSTIKNTARVSVESLASDSKKIKKGIQYPNIQTITNMAQKGNGIILMAAHFGNWEIGCSALPLQTDIPVYGVYKPIKNKSVDTFIRELRGKYGLRLIPRNKIARIIASNTEKKIPGVYILIADQNPNSKNDVIWTDFLNIKTAHTQGPQKLKDKYNLDVLYMHVNPLDNLYEYEIRFEKMEGQNLMQEYSDMLTQQIIEKPEFWLWSHRRWKRNPES